MKPLIYYRKHDANISSQTGLSKLSNHAIYAQYMRDVLHCYDNDSINEIEFERINERLYFELNKRKLQYSLSSENRFSSLTKRFRMKMLVRKYKLTLQ